MLQIKDKKSKYRNTVTKRKAAFSGRGFQLDSQTFNKSMNLTIEIILRRGKNRTGFSGETTEAQDK